MNASHFEKQRIDLPKDLTDRWDNSVQTLAQLVHAEICLITEAVPEGMIIRACSDISENPYQVNDLIVRRDSLFCAQVVKQRKRLIMVDTEVAAGFNAAPSILYCGEPIHKANNQLYGTLCVLNTDGEVKKYQVESTVSRFARLIESDLKWQSYLNKS